MNLNICYVMATKNPVTGVVYHCVRHLYITQKLRKNQQIFKKMLINFRFSFLIKLIDSSYYAVVVCFISLNLTQREYYKEKKKHKNYI